MANIKNKKIVKKLSKKNKKKIVKKLKNNNKKKFFNHFEKLILAHGFDIKNNSNQQIINSNVSLNGNLLFKNGNILLLGKFQGNINCNKIILVQNSSILGEIHCNEIIIYGRCNASIFIKNKCILKKGSIVVGDIHYDRDIEIETGAKILGKLIPKSKLLALPYYNSSKEADVADDTNYLSKEEINSSNNIKINSNKNNESAKIKNVKDFYIDNVIKKIFR